MAIAEYQGNFNADASFFAVTDQGANTYVPNTIYITNGTTVYVTKDGGNTWHNRTLNLPAGIAISSIVVDPTDEDNVFVTSSAGVAGRQRLRAHLHRRCLFMA